jgi:hypothetical protein
MTISDILKLQRIPLPNFAASGALGTSAATVDSAAAFSINQTTAAISISLPIPTVNFDADLLFIQNIGTSEITVDGVKIPPKRYTIFSFAHSEWLPLVSISSTAATAGGEVKKFYLKTALSAGTNVINHNLGLAIPKAYVMKMIDDQSGAEVFARVTATTANSLSITTISNTATVNITIMG